MATETLLRQIRLRTKPLESTYQAGGAVGIDQATYSRVERGEMNVSPELAEKIALHFKVPMDVIFSPSRYTAAAKEQLAEMEAKAS